MQDFRNLEVWKKAHLVVISIYRLTANFPSTEIYGITSQIRRASVSIPTNLAEGVARAGDMEFRRFVRIGFASASEVEYLLFLSLELKYLVKEDYDIISMDIHDVKKMLSGLQKKLTESLKRKSKD